MKNVIIFVFGGGGIGGVALFVCGEGCCTLLRGESGRLSGFLSLALHLHLAFAAGAGVERWVQCWEFVWV